MPTEVPNVYDLQDLSPAWVDTLRTAMTEINAVPSSRVALSLATGWIPFAGSWTDPQVAKWGRLVLMSGLIKNNTGATVTPSNTLIATIPVGYRPRAVGSASPLGGRLLTPQFSGSATGAVRLDIVESTGQILFTFGAALGNGGYISMTAMWTTD